QLCTPLTCGNNNRDYCARTPDGSSYCSGVTVHEPCDGTDLGGQTCQYFGYGAGELACAPDCSGFVASGCRACMSAASIVRCGPAPAPMATVPRAADIAATDSEIALTWVEADDTGRPVALWFGRLTPELDVIDATPLDEPGVASN